MILTVPERHGQLEKLLKQIKGQAGKQVSSRMSVSKMCTLMYITYKNVEVVIISDNKTISIGKKRNIAMNQATGGYFTFIDDDDVISDDYLSEILKATEAGPDCISYRSKMYVNGKKMFDVDFDYKYAVDNTIGKHAHRLPNHLAIWKTAKFRKLMFVDSNFGEDGKWAVKVKPYVKNWAKIDKVLYFYMQTKDGICQTIQRKHA